MVQIFSMFCPRRFIVTIIFLLLAYSQVIWSCGSVCARSWLDVEGLARERVGAKLSCRIEGWWILLPFVLETGGEPVEQLVAESSVAPGSFPGVEERPTSLWRGCRTRHDNNIYHSRFIYYNVVFFLYIYLQFFQLFVVFCIKYTNITIDKLEFVAV